MENGNSNNISSSNLYERSAKAPVELVLLGIDKIWVRGANGQWREKGMEHQPANLISAEGVEDNETETRNRKWWQFWKK